MGWSCHDGEGWTPHARRSELPHAHGPVVGWMSSHRTGGRWPGVLLHHDAFLVFAEPQVLQEPPGDLVVRVGEASRAIDEILLITEPGPADRAAGMVRLAHPVENAPTVVIDLVSLTRAWSDQRSLWSSLRDLGVVPADWPARTVPTTAADRPAAIAVKSVPAGPADWCTIFWWLC